MTVSRVINHHPRVSDATAQRVREAIAQLNYSAAPSLRKRGRPSRAFLGIHSGQIAMATVGMGVDTSYRPVIEKTLVGVAKVMDEDGLHLMKLNLDHNRVLPVALDRRSIDGLLIAGVKPDAEMMKAIGSIPMVSVYHFDKQRGLLDNVRPDNAKVAELAAEAFLSLGHRRVAFFDPSPGHQEFTERKEAFVLKMADAGGSVVSYHRGSCAFSSDCAEPDLDRRVLDHLLDEFLEDVDHCKAIFSPSDLVSAALHRRFRERGVDPADYELISCNNEPSYLEGLFPEPKVIDIRADIIGATAARRLLKRISDPACPIEEILVEPVWRKSMF